MIWREPDKETPYGASSSRIDIGHYDPADEVAGSDRCVTECSGGGRSSGHRSPRSPPGWGVHDYDDGGAVIDQCYYHNRATGDEYHFYADFYVLNYRVCIDYDDYHLPGDDVLNDPVLHDLIDRAVEHGPGEHHYDDA